jgi:hypothetical protein
LIARITLRVFAIIIIFIAVLCMIFPQPARLLFTIALGALSANRYPPQIVEGQFSNDEWRDDTKATERFTAFLKQKFPEGTDVSLLRSGLLGAGFKQERAEPRCQPPVQVEPLGWVSWTCSYSENVLRYTWSNGIACGSGLVAYWSADDGNKIARIKGAYYHGCS